MPGMRALGALLLLVLLTAVPASGRAVAVFNGKIAFSSARDGNYEIYTMEPDASDQSRLTTAAQTDIDPDWSPDGKQIAFTSNRDGNDEIYVMNADGSGQRRLTTDPATDKNPTWAPGGRDLAFLSERDGNAEIYVMNADGSGQRRLTNGVFPDVNPAWSPDGQRIAFASNRDGNYEIFTMAVDGSDQRRLTTAPGEDVSPAWSPDGKQIAFASNRDGNYELYAMSPDGTGQARLTRNLDTDLDPAWAPNGASIAFTSNRAGNNEIYTMDADGSAPARLTTNTAEDTTPSWQALAGPPEPRDAVKQARFKGVWKESHYGGALELVGRVSRPAVLTVALRQGGRVRLSATMPLPRGAFRRSVPLPRGLLPGRYLLDVGLVGSPEEKTTQRIRLTLAAPPEGVVSQAWASAVIGGLPAVRFPRSTWLVASHFRFAALPRPGRAVVVAWYDPSGRLARSIRKPRAQSIAAFLATRDRSPMPAGAWQVVLRAGPAVVARVRYRIG
jgi:dipeptidyl aminopeptidase/acylaminoacyl peptidase